ncbi:uncharacterized protein E0L32_007089 [Thyridium curvatum]|uniref:Ras-GAP domain-containing protein n=1 Tax=Thyridium curvatum TaxID=1093900 RepID=A0A507AWV7_9PEZI|nr:uncharacterized protein E0L32_007089 [Thyridium curvatum]TPX12203.1 hypothetical protein E0L32_007089 [Thyridium curvatum]
MEAHSPHNDDDPPPLPARSPAVVAPTISPPTTTESPAAPGIKLERRSSAGNLFSSFRSNTMKQNTIRSVTPEPTDDESSIRDGSVGAARGGRSGARPFESASPQSSPRSIPGGGSLSAGGSSRRQGIVFNDPVAGAGSYDSTSSSPPPRQTQASTRPRTHTMDGATVFRQQLAPAVSADARHRMGSFSSGGSLPVEEMRTVSLHSPPPEIAYGYSASTMRASDLQGRSASKEKKYSTRRLTKRPEISRPTSPIINGPPSVDSLPVPVPTQDAPKMLLAMKTLCGRMRGEIEYQTDSQGPWYPGVAYIDEERGSLMFESGENGPFHIAIVPDLRGCRVMPIMRSEDEGVILEISSTELALEIVLRPFVTNELDLWLAALLGWQQLRPGNARGAGGGKKSNMPVVESHDPWKRGSAAKSKDGSIIKMEKMMFWDKGLAATPRAIMKRASTRDLRSPQTSWRRVSCMLQGNGELRLMTINDVSVLCVIGLSQLSRCAIQQLDRSVLEEQYCIAIFPTYASTATQISVFRPVYIALDTRVAFEVWFVLLRAFTIPELYGIDPAKDEPLHEVLDIDTDAPAEMFRIEKSLNLRLTEAKMRSQTMDGANSGERHFKDNDPSLVGHYLAEVLLDGEVRARTTVKADTKNPFWREDYDFVDLPSTLPYLSVVVKRVDGNLDTLGQSLRSSSNLPRYGVKELPYGSVDVALSQMENGKDHEQWHQIYDERQRAVGSLLLRIHQEELVVLLSKDYQPIADLLHHSGSQLTAQIAAFLPSNTRRVAEVFLNIYQASGKASEWIMALVEEEIDGIGNQQSLKLRFSKRLKSSESIDSSTERETIVRDMGKSLAGEANLLFRGNSLLTQALECHMRRLGKEYLEQVLAAKIFEINQINPDCELDPAKLSAIEDLPKHLELLMQFTEEIWDCIIKSAARLPPELRQILKYVRAVAEDRYGDFLRTVAYTSVSGFLFLRFICPAILNPKLFGLLRDHPRPRAQRTLTLIAKTLQALANLSAIGKKEAWMEPMNRFINAQRKSVRDFIDAVCAIPAERATPAHVPAYSAPNTVLKRLDPIAGEGFPSLPYLVDYPRNYAALVRMWVESHPPGSTETHLYEGPLLEFHGLCADLHHRTEHCAEHLQESRAAAAASAEDGASQMSSELAELLDYASLSDTMTSTAAWTGASNAGVGADFDGMMRPPGSSGSEFSTEGLQHRTGVRGTSVYPGAGPSSQRQVSGSSDVGGTMRSLRNGKHARKFLSGFITRKGRDRSPEGSSPAGGRFAPGNINNNGKDKEKAPGFGFGESWGSGSMSGSDATSRFS